MASCFRPIKALDSIFNTAVEAQVKPFYFFWCVHGCRGYSAFSQKKSCFLSFFSSIKSIFFTCEQVCVFIMASSSPHSVCLDWFLKLSAVWWGDKWAEGTCASEYDKHFDRVRLFDYLPGSNKSESAYKFHLGKSMNNVIGITDLHYSNG